MLEKTDLHAWKYKRPGRSSAKQGFHLCGTMTGFSKLEQSVRRVVDTGTPSALSTSEDLTGIRWMRILPTHKSAHIFEGIRLSMTPPDGSGNECSIEKVETFMLIKMGATSAALLLEGIAVVKSQTIEWTMTCEGILLSLWPKNWKA